MYSLSAGGLLRLHNSACRAETWIIGVGQGQSSGWVLSVSIFQSCNSSVLRSRHPFASYRYDFRLHHFVWLQLLVGGSGSARLISSQFYYLFCSVSKNTLAVIFFVMIIPVQRSFLCFVCCVSLTYISFRSAKAYLRYCVKNKIKYSTGTYMR